MSGGDFSFPEPPERDLLVPVLCLECEQVITDTPVEKPTSSFVNKTVFFHAACWETRVAARKARDVELRRAALDTKFLRSTMQERTFFPQWAYARLENREFRGRVSKRLLTAVDNYQFQDGNLMLSAFTGSGKTSLAVAWLHRELERAKASTQPGSTGQLPAFAFITAPELVQSRRQTKLGSGDEAPLVRLAMSAELLILDEVGFELPGEVVFDVLDRRLRALSPSIVTTGLAAKDFRDRYGDALYRRIAAEGAVIEDW